MCCRCGNGRCFQGQRQGQPCSWCPVCSSKHDQRNYSRTTFASAKSSDFSSQLPERRAVTGSNRDATYSSCSESTANCGPCSSWSKFGRSRDARARYRRCSSKLSWKEERSKQPKHGNQVSRRFSPFFFPLIRYSFQSVPASSNEQQRNWKLAWRRSVLVNPETSGASGSSGATEEAAENRQLYQWRAESRVVHTSRLQSSIVPIALASLRSTESVISVSCGIGHAVALTDSHRVFTWGAGGNGQLGHGSLVSYDQPRQLEALEGTRVVRVAAGG